MPLREPARWDAKIASGWAGITLAPVCTCHFLQCGKAAYCCRGCSDETATSKFAHIIAPEGYDFVLMI
jgi:hypothetical protein